MLVPVVSLSLIIDSETSSSYRIQFLTVKRFFPSYSIAACTLIHAWATQVTQLVLQTCPFCSVSKN